MILRETTVRDQFLRDVAVHEMEVQLDIGRNKPENYSKWRHIRFSNPSRNRHWFDLITWPGALCIDGDMGTWVFRRTNDMFGFFRGEELSINPSYWAEKLQGDGAHRAAKEFSADEFRSDVLETISGFGDDSPVDLLVSEAKNDLQYLEDERDLREAASEHCDVSEIDGRVFTSKYLWCCYAIVWGIQKYDAAKGGDA